MTANAVYGVAYHQHPPAEIDRSRHLVAQRLLGWLPDHMKHARPSKNRFRWRSPIRGRWLTSVVGTVLLALVPIVTMTGLLSYIAYAPALGQALPQQVGFLHLPHFNWPTSPSWLYRLTQGLHIVLGLALVPVVLAKLWSVLPKFFSRPPIRSPAHALERLSLIMLVGGIIFELVTGVLNIQYDYVFGFSFYTAHYFGAWVFIAGFIAHLVVKLPAAFAALCAGSFRRQLRTALAETQPDDDPDDNLIAVDPEPATISRRGALAMIGGGSLLLAGLSAGQVIGGITRPTALLLPRGRDAGSGPNGFQVNRTAAAAGVADGDVDASWRLSIQFGARTVELSRDHLAAMSQHTAQLPIACVEGWSTTQTWTGVQLSKLAALVDADDATSATVRSLEDHGVFNRARLQSNQIHHGDSLLALMVNEAQLSLDHGYPARIIVPAMPGVHNTKWVQSIQFEARHD